ncbi:MAG: protoporphyrinogen oxidase [bacterium]
MERVAIIGAGVSGLTLAYELLERDSTLNVVVLEARERAGGNVWTERVNGYLCEVGANGFLDNKPGTLKLSAELNLQPIRSNDNARKRFIYTGGELKKLPDSTGAFFLSNYLSLGARLRMIGEYFVPKADYEDESLESFAVRRVGREFFEKLLDPMASGIYAGDPAQMSIRSCFGKVYDLEQKYGGLIKGFMALAKEKKKSGQKAEAGPGGVLHSYQDGMRSLIEALRNRIGDRIKTGKSVSGIEKKGDGYAVHCKDGSSVDSDCVVLATPAYDSAAMLRDMDASISDVLKQIPYPPIAVVALGFKKEKITRDTNFFGFLVTGTEKRKILGCLFDSSLFPNRAPEGHILLRCMIGGARAPELALMNDEKLLDTVRAELADIADIKADPDFVWHYRYEKAIPQYLVGHHEKLKTLDERVLKHKGLYLAGNAYKGVAVNDCIASGKELAGRIVQIKGK